MKNLYKQEEQVNNQSKNNIQHHTSGYLERAEKIRQETHENKSMLNSLL